MEIPGDIFNVANMLNKKWGINKPPGNHALYIPGVSATANINAFPAFHAVNKVFNYLVNNSDIITPGGNPFQIQIGARYSF